MTIGAGLSSYIPTANTSLYLKLNGNTNDSSGLGNNGTNNGVSFVNGMFGQGGEFLSPDYIATPLVGSTFNTSGITIHAWVNVGGVTNNSWNQIVSIRSLATSWFILSMGQDGTNNRPNFWVENSSGTRYSIYGNAISDSNWHLLTAVQFGTNIFLYQDGVQVSTATIVSGFSLGTNTVSIGRDARTGLNWFAGKLDEIIIENTGGWTSKQVATCYNQAIGKFSIV